MKQISEFCSNLPDVFEHLKGAKEASIDSIKSPDLATSSCATFVSKPSELDSAIKNNARVIFVATSLLKNPALETAKNIFYHCKNIQIGMALVLPLFDSRGANLGYNSGLSPKAFIHSSANIGKNVTIGPFTTIGPDVIIGENTIIGPNCTIEGKVKIGTNSFLHSQVYIGHSCNIGSHVILQPFASIGSDGYGYAPTKTGILKIPQIGIVEIEDYVEIGSNTCIDRATINSTKIGYGTKIDNLVHIAHNCIIGKYCFITAGFAMAGSSEIGDYFMCGGTCAIADHIKITNNVVLAGASVVTGDITEPGQYGGAPVQAMGDYLKTKASFPYLPKLKKQVSKIMKHLNLEE